MNSDASPTFPKLAAPGAGLPMPELVIARLIFGWFRKTRSSGAVNALFEEERDAILAMARDCGADAGSRRILIKRIPGMEDSSRDWSVHMTLEHLRIVNAAVSGVIAGLAAGQPPATPASTAAVKPAPGVGHEVLETFRTGCAEWLETVAAVADLRTVERFAHPWFGPLDAAGWQAMAAFHMRLHRKQVEAIVRQLR
jgi:mono/diheme cytochrome c family protein